MTEQNGLILTADGTGNNADSDDDNDGWLDTVEINCETDPLDILSVPIDTDGDGEPNCIDIDDDNDTYLDTRGCFPARCYRVDRFRQ